MKLTLSVVSYHRFTSDFDAKKTFVSNGKPHGFLIGRSNQCDWCLPDPERVISGNHARIDSQNNDFSIIDLSTNGLFINRSVEPLGEDKTHILCDGDLLAFGDYEIEVSLRQSASNTLDKQRHILESTEQVDEENLSLRDDWHFGIPSSQLNQSGAADNNMLSETPSKLVGFATPPPVFMGNIEDSFVAPASEHCGLEVNDELTIPEDWGVTLNVASSVEPVSTQASSSVQRRTEDDAAYEINQPSKPEERTSLSPPKSLLVDDSSPEIEAFIRGLGISRNIVPSESDEQWWFELGTSMQHLMTGLMDTLHHRSAFKQNNRLNQTLFKRQENNPLKFSATVEDAIHNLFNRKSSSFLPAEQAINEAYTDIEKHEQAILAGVNGTVNGMMKLLSPESIIGRGSEQMFWSRLNPAHSKAKNWATYEAMYHRLEQDLNCDNTMFYLDDFAKAYEAHLKGIK